MIVRAVGIVGAGTMGQGIAVACAAAGLDVLVSERTPQSAQAALAEIVQGLDHDIAKWRRTESEKRAILARIRTVDSFGALEAAQSWEAVPDDLERDRDGELDPCARRRHPGHPTPPPCP